MGFFRMPDIFYTKPAPPTLFKERYGKKPMQTINVRIPDGDGPFPTIFLIHGGQWKKAYTHKQMEYLAEELKAQGITTCNLEFKRLGHIDGGYPGTFRDLLDGIAYCLQHANEWKLDTNKLSILGHSSGAHLAFCLCGAKDFDGHALSPDSALGFTPYSAIGIAGVYDLRNAREGLQTPINDFFGDHPKLSPIEMLPTGIRQRLIVGDQDKLTEQALSYVEAAQEAGEDITFTLVKGCSHFRVIDPTFEGWATILNAITEITK
jgi:acetyl esterase/lipase